MPIVKPLRVASAALIVLEAVACARMAHDDDARDFSEGVGVVVEGATCRIDYEVSSQWDTGFSATVNLTNKGPAVGTWKLEWDYTAGQTITPPWNATSAQSGAHVTMTNVSWNGALATGASASFGFNGNSSGANPPPANFKFNGVACGTSSTTATGGTGGTTGSGGAGGSSASGGSAGKGGAAGAGSSTATSGSGGSSGACSAPAYTTGTYAGGEIVSSHGALYQCKPPPFSGWCGLGGAYEPGVGFAWQDAWTLVGACTGGTSGTTSAATTGTTGTTSSTGAGGAGSTGGTGGAGGSGGGTSGLAAIVNESTFNAMFPKRINFYTYQGLLQAVSSFPAFANSTDAIANKREVAAFLANVAHETQGLVFIDEVAKADFCASSAGCPCAPGKQYFGRGPLQLSWNFNYCAAGSALGLPLQSTPELLSQDQVASWKASLWFWMQDPGAGSVTCHQAITSGAGFGATIRAINGALECGGANVGEMQDRVNFYLQFCATLGVDPGSGQTC
jgi:predicted chitinase